MALWRALAIGLLLSGFAVLDAPEAEAQSRGRSWVPWAESAPASRPSSRRGSRSIFEDDDDDDFWGPSRSPKYPAFLEGGPRPYINPSAPPQVKFTAGYPAGTVIVDTAGRALYYVTSTTSAYRYPISVGREGFTWRGTEKISRVQAWPDWRPPAEMRQRDPKLPELMSGGVNNPLGAKALYLGNTLYRIHGTNDSRTIGYAASSGCFRMMNQHVEHLAGIVKIGATVHVLERLPRQVASN